MLCIIKVEMQEDKRPASPERLLVRVEISNIVYWLDNMTGTVYTYSDTPTRIGKALKNEEGDLHVILREDWKETMAAQMQVFQEHTAQ